MVWGSEATPDGAFLLHAESDIFAGSRSYG